MDCSKAFLQACVLFLIGMLIYTGISWGGDPFTSTRVFLDPASTLQVRPCPGGSAVTEYAHTFEVVVEIQYTSIYFTVTGTTGYSSCSGSTAFPASTIGNYGLDPFWSYYDSTGMSFADMLRGYDTSVQTRRALSADDLYNVAYFGEVLRKVYNYSTVGGPGFGIDPFFKSEADFMNNIRNDLFGWICPTSLDALEAMLMVRFIAATARLAVSAWLVFFIICCLRSLLDKCSGDFVTTIMDNMKRLILVVEFVQLVAEIVVFILLKNYVVNKQCSSGAAAHSTVFAMEKSGYSVNVDPLINACLHVLVGAVWAFIHHAVTAGRRQAAIEEARDIIANQPPPNPVAAAAVVAQQDADAPNPILNNNERPQIDLINASISGAFGLKGNSSATGENDAATEMQKLLQDIVPQFPEFKSANEQIALVPHWIRSSRLRRYTAALSNTKYIPIPEDGNNFNRQAATLAVIKGFRCRAQDAKTVSDPISGKQVLPQLEVLFNYAKNSLDADKRRAFCTALQVLADFGHADELNALLSQVVDRAHRCESAKQHGVNALILASGVMLEKRVLQRMATVNNNTNNNNIAAAPSPAKSGFLRSNAHTKNPKRRNLTLEPLFAPIPSNNHNRNGNDDDAVDDLHRPSGSPVLSLNPAALQQESSQNFTTIKMIDASSLSPHARYAKSMDYTDLISAHKRFFEIIDDFLDDYKMRAFSSSLFEPARYYFNLRGMSSGYDSSVEIHGINWYLILVEDGLGFGLPISSAKDTYSTSFCNFWPHFTEQAEPKIWSVFSNPLNFGKAAAKLKSDPLIKNLKSSDAKPDPKKLGSDENTDRFRDLLKVDGNRRKALSKMVEKFAFFFSYPFFVKKMLTTLNSEIKPEHAGFRNACGRLFEEFQRLNLDQKLAPKIVLDDDSSSEYGYNFSHAKNPLEPLRAFGTLPEDNSTSILGNSDASVLSSTQRPSAAPVVKASEKDDATADVVAPASPIVGGGAAVGDMNVDSSIQLPPEEIVTLNPTTSSKTFVEEKQQIKPQYATYEDFDDWCFNDEYFLEMNVDRVAMFFAWLGILEPLEKGESIGDMIEKMEQEEEEAKKKNSNNGVAAVTAGSSARKREPLDSGSFGKNDATEMTDLASTNLNDQLIEDEEAVAAARREKWLKQCNRVVWPKHKSEFPQFTLDNLGQEPSGFFLKPFNTNASTEGGMGGGVVTTDSDLRQNEEDVFDNTCPICLETSEDILPLAHLNAIGDTSSHRMCGSCREQFGQSGKCPFCREAVVSEMFAVEANRFAAEVAKLISRPNQNNVDAQAASDLYETWELIELEHGDQRLLERICLNALKDPRCGGTIVRAAQNNAPWLRHIAAVVIRFHAIVSDRRKNGVLDQQIEINTIRALEQAVKNIVDPFEFGGNNGAAAAAAAAPNNREDLAVKWNGGEWASIVNQALTALLSAVRGGLSVETLKSVNLRLMRGMIQCLNDPSRITPDKKAAHAAQVKTRVSRHLLHAARRVLWEGRPDEFAAAFNIPEN